MTDESEVSCRLLWSVHLKKWNLDLVSFCQSQDKCQFCDRHRDSRERTVHRPRPETGLSGEGWSSLAKGRKVVSTYSQRNSKKVDFFSEYFCRPFPRLVLSCINADFCDQGRSFLHFSRSTCFLCTIPDLCDFSNRRTILGKKFMMFADFHRRQQFLQNSLFVSFYRISPQCRRVSIILQRVMPRSFIL